MKPVQHKLKDIQSIYPGTSDKVEVVFKDGVSVMVDSVTFDHAEELINLHIPTYQTQQHGNDTLQTAS